MKDSSDITQGKEYTQRLLEIYDVNVVSTVFGVIAATILFGYVYYPSSNHNLLFCWIVAQFLVSFSRLYTRRLYYRGAFEDAKQYIRYIYINQVLTAACWAVIPFFFVDYNSVEIQLITYVCFSAFAAVATTSMAGFELIGTIYISLTLVPLMISSHMNSTSNSFELVFVVFVYFVYQVLTLVRNSKSAKQYILKTIDLLNSESLIRNIVDVSVDAIVSLDRNGTIIDWNNAAVQILGWEKHEVVGSPVSSIINIRGHQNFFADLPSITTANPPERRSLITVYNRFHHEIILDIIIRQAFTSDESIFILYLRDETELIISEQELKRTDARIRNLLDSVDTGIIEIEFSGAITFINQTALETLGYKKGELLENFFDEKLQYKDLDGQKTRWRDSKIFECLKLGKELHLDDQILWHKNGDIVHVQLSSVPVYDAKENRMAIISFTDITKTFNILQDQRRLLQISEASPDLMLTFTRDGEILSINKSARDIFGIPNSELSKKMTLEDLFTDQKLLSLINDEALPLTHENNFWAGEILYTTIYGMDIYFSVYLLALQSDSNIEYYSLVMSDITERIYAQKSLETAKNEAEAAANAKSDFLATMSHEIRTPLNGILGMAEILEDTPLNPEQLDYLATISQSGKSLLTIINDILDFSKIEAGHMEMDAVDFDLERSVYDICSLLMTRANEKNLELILNFSPDCPRLVRGDAGRIRQILVNLVGNAIKFTEKGYICLQVESIPDIGNDLAHLQFSVIDTGIGIPISKQALLFESFTQADSSTTRKFGGTGLGLSISKKLVELMGGKISVESKVGEGSRFIFDLSLPILEHRTKLTSKSLHSRRVLIVDDNKVNLQVLFNQLQHFGMRVSTATNHAEAIDSLKSAADNNEAFELVIVDYLMPEVDGAELGEMILNDTQIPPCPLVVYSSLARRGDAKLFEEIGFSGYLTKPSLSQILHDTLEKVLGEFNNPTSSKAGIITRYQVQDSKNDNILRHDFKGVKVLLAEDNVVNQKVAKNLLEKHGFKVDIVDNGEKAVDKFKQHQYDIVLMDCQMPIKDGFEASDEILEHQRQNELQVPIIALTANASKSDRDKCLAIGMKSFVPKPFSSEILLSTLHKALDDDSSPTLDKSIVSSSSYPSLDIKSLNELKSLMEEDFEELVLAFMQSAQTGLDQMWIAHETQDWETLQREAHSLKSASANLGASQLSHLAKVVEQDCKENSEIQLTQLQAMREEFHTVSQLLSKFQQSNTD